MKNSIECINHVTLNTGHNCKSPRSEVSNKTIEIISSWLDGAIKSNINVCLPTSDLKNYTAYATEAEDGLMVTISGNSKQILGGEPVPLVTMCVVNQEHKENDVWQLMTGPHMPKVARGVVCPEKPYLGVSIWPMAFLYFEALEWLGDLERCIAWAWLERKKKTKDASIKESSSKDESSEDALMREGLELISVGKSLPNPFPGEGPRLLMQKSGLSVVINIHNPDQYEVNALSKSSHPMKIGYASYDRLGILILDFTDFSFDLPFDAGIENAVNIPDLTIKTEKERISILVISADSLRSHKVIGIRGITMSPRVSRLVADKIAKQASSPISRNQYGALVEEMYRKFPTIKDIKKSAIAFDKAGHD